MAKSLNYNAVCCAIVLPAFAFVHGFLYQTVYALTGKETHD